VCHLRDTEEGFMLRFETIMASDNPRLAGPDPDRWAEERQYHRNNTRDAFNAFRRRRMEMLTLLRSLSAADWERAGIHLGRGRLTLGEWVASLAGHDDNHLEQLRRALAGRP
jgi:hypothetical protein